MYITKHPPLIATVLAGSIGLTLAACSAAHRAAPVLSRIETAVVGERGDHTTGTTSSAADATADTASSSTVEELLFKLPGVEVTRTGPDVKVRIDGLRSVYSSTDPLFVVDGIPLPRRGIVQALSLVHGRDIERIDILRDAAATSRFGSRGANGAIVITTSGP